MCCNYVCVCVCVLYLDPILRLTHGVHSSIHIVCSCIIWVTCCPLLIWNTVLIYVRLHQLWFYNVQWSISKHSQIFVGDIDLWLLSLDIRTVIYSLFLVIYILFILFSSGYGWDILWSWWNNHWHWNGKLFHVCFVYIFPSLQKWVLAHLNQKHFYFETTCIDLWHK